MPKTSLFLFVNSQQLRYPENRMGFKACVEKARNHLVEKLPFALYRKPGESQGTAIFQNNDVLMKVQDFTESGFVFAPFANISGTILIPPDDLLDWSYTSKGDTIDNLEVDTSVEAVDREFHISLVEKGIGQILEGKLQKVVLTRKMEYGCKSAPIAIFHELLDSYPNAFCYLWYHPKVGLWLGATPETLLKLEKNKVSTMSLAGTKPYIKGEQPDWGEKEQKEQELVTNYILKVLEPHVADLSLEDKSTERAGNLWHLRTGIRGKSRSSGLKNIVEALHPTPAVCGLPLDRAKAFILDFERYDREYYTGFLGELNLTKNTADLFVNLRCMQLKDKIATVYIGGGITKDSDPEQEWEETRLKSKTILKVLKASEE